MTLQGVRVRTGSRSVGLNQRAGTPKTLVPARNTRHRIACLALYRRLLIQASFLPIPHRTTEKHKADQVYVKDLIGRSFRRNRTDTSPRLVAPALRAGYRFLELLSSARDPESPEFKDVLAFLRERKRSRNAKAPPKDSHDALPAQDQNKPHGGLERSIESKMKKKKKAGAVGTIDSESESTTAAAATAAINHNRHPNGLPLLQRVWPPPSDDPPPNLAYGRHQPELRKYEPLYTPTPSHRPRPASQLGGTGIRKIPHIEMALDVPFLRIKKPQPRRLQTVIQQKINKGIRLREQLMVLNEGQALEEAKLEDEWDRIVADAYASHLEQVVEEEDPDLAGKFIKEKKEAEAEIAAAGLGVNVNVNDLPKDFRKKWNLVLSSQDAHLDMQPQQHKQSSFHNTVWDHALRYVYQEIEWRRMDLVARANAMREIIKGEKKLAKEEEAEREEEKEKGRKNGKQKKKNTSSSVE